VSEAEKECFWGKERCRCIGLTTLPPSLSRLSNNVGSLTSHNAICFHGDSFIASFSLAVAQSLLRSKLYEELHRRNSISRAPTPSLGLRQPPAQWVPGLMRRGLEADHSPPTGAEAKNGFVAWGLTGTTCPRFECD
jgi:hypothetical protein